MLSILGCIEISTESLCDSGVTTDVVIVFLPSWLLLWVQEWNSLWFLNVLARRRLAQEYRGK
jgi:hypothetical protein